MKQIHKKQLLTLCIDFFLVFFIITRQLYSKLPEIASFTILGIFIFFTIIYCIENIFFEAKVDKFYYFICFCFVFGAIWSLIISKDPYPLFCVMNATTF